MEGLYFLAPTLLAILLSMLFVRAGAIMLVLTGMRYEQAKFQALSAFTATGFTTREAERVVNHPVRRKIISILMIGGYAGVATVIVGATIAFATTSSQTLPEAALILTAGVLIIYLIARSSGLMGYWEAFIERLLRKRLFFEFEPVEELLHLADGYGLVKLEMRADSPLIGQTIIEIGSERKGVLILGIERNHSWLPARQMQDVLQEGDELVIYGHLQKMKAEFETAYLPD
ncbi:TrkA-C domain-containing protein [Mariprofundus ferrinatatus]|uniref:TrkA-C domain-containing protein n=1 Tax=Mariprofundus ferrinatatus TaxID=1921087 RepID=A0A2K8LCB2_9PROT|nr:TrkA C-terminal domain-containing protein [Mariprofundus ferrinatatus]ATX81926.1 TrkA-C domain-containing protein [Mariprofundus ferrinatatus]